MVAHLLQRLLEVGWPGKRHGGSCRLPATHALCCPHITHSAVLQSTHGDPCSVPGPRMEKQASCLPRCTMHTSCLPLLQRYEREHGEEFEGREGQFDQLYSLASTLLGSSLSKKMLLRLVKAYLGV